MAKNFLVSRDDQESIKIIGLFMIIFFTSFSYRFFILHALVISILVTTATLVIVLSGEASQKDKERWDKKYNTEKYISGKDPINFLRNHVHLLPKGKALDIAMGEGRNGVYLATQGFDVTGVDISEVGLGKAHTLAKEHGVSIQTKVVDLEKYQLPISTYDFIICTYYLQRDLFPKIIQALKPGGMLMVETYTLDHVKYYPYFPKKFLLESNELFYHFKNLEILKYQIQDDGKTAYASILAKKP